MTDADPTPEWLRLNRMNWDERAGIHAASEFYGVREFQVRRSTLRSFETGEVGDVSGRTLLHLQCHMGQDTLSWARSGAHAIGLDFSEPAIRTARQLAEDMGLAGQARFVVSDVYGAETALRGDRFDIVYTGLGALVWLPDLVRWAKVVASLLNPGGIPISRRPSACPAFVFVTSDVRACTPPGVTVTLRTRTPAGVHGLAEGCKARAWGGVDEGDLRAHPGPSAAGASRRRLRAGGPARRIPR